MLLLLGEEEAWGYMSQTALNEHLETQPSYDLSRCYGLTGFRWMVLLQDVMSSGSGVLWGLDQAAVSKIIGACEPRAGPSPRSFLSPCLWPCPPSIRVAGLLTCQLRAPTTMKVEAIRPRTGSVTSDITHCQTHSRPVLIQKRGSGYQFPMGGGD